MDRRAPDRSTAALSGATLRQRLFARILAAGDRWSRDAYSEVKAALLGDAHGRVVEIGPGTGVNLSFYPSDVRWIGVEPNPALHGHLRERALASALPFEIRREGAERMGLGPGSADVVVSTLALCSVADVGAVLAEVRRVLKAGGRFVFLEHVADRPGTWRCRLQRTLPYTPWRLLTDGCNPARDIASHLEAAGFASLALTRYEHERVGWARVAIGPHVCGHAVA